MPAKIPSPQSLPDKWAPYWEQQRTYEFDRTAAPDRVFSIDSPPLTVSGTLHIGHLYSYTHTDVIARFQRMRGKAVCYPVGFDDNGLPTERRVQNYYGVRVDPTISESTNGVVGRARFRELCARLTARDEQIYERAWRRLGLSVDWSLSYRTMDERSQVISQRAFLRNLARGEAYRSEAPTLWDVTFHTAVAQAESVDREIPGAFLSLRFVGPDCDIAVETTRPELLPACVALVAHPDDARYQRLFGRTARTPLFDVEVPIHPHRQADPDKGSGIAMVCTFGDPTDVVWWRDLALDTRAVLGFDGRFRTEPPSGVDSDRYAILAGKSIEEARADIVQQLRDSGTLLGPPRPVTHSVPFYEKGERPLEIVPSRQWYIRNGGRDEELREQLLRRGAQLCWHPEWMRSRFNGWVEGLRGDWLISRQRFWGVPFPLWYRLDDTGQPGEVLIPDETALPLDPTQACPPGFRPDQRDQPGGFTAERDIMDTWATSSLTPLIGTAELTGPPRQFDLHPQAHEIIRTWLFTTLLRAHVERDELPWRNAAISGWVVDSQHEKIGKSAGNAESPEALLDQFGPDAIRYWAARGRLGYDLTFDLNQVKVGRRLATKLLNASRFVLSFEATEEIVDRPLDRALLAGLSTVVSDATAALELYDHARALERIERFFWQFCDDYIELVKERAYAGCPSARTTLRSALAQLQRLLAPYLPFVTEESWSWWQSGSVHLTQWPEPGDAGEDATLHAASTVLTGIRQQKSAAGLSMRTPVGSIRVAGSTDLVAAAARAATELQQAAHADQIEFTEAEGPLVVSVNP